MRGSGGRGAREGEGAGAVLEERLEFVASSEYSLMFCLCSGAMHT